MSREGNFNVILKVLNMMSKCKNFRIFVINEKVSASKHSGGK